MEIKARDIESADPTEGRGRGRVREAHGIRAGMRERRFLSGIYLCRSVTFLRSFFLFFFFFSFIPRRVRSLARSLACVTGFNRADETNISDR